MSETRTIMFEKIMPHSPEKIWCTLTDSALIARWLMANDFSPFVGHRFNFKSKPMEHRDGIVHCEVLACEPPRLLRYSWKSSAGKNVAPGSRLDTIVTWTLTPAEAGTHVRMEQEGFRLPENEPAYKGANFGWSRLLEGLERVTREG